MIGTATGAVAKFPLKNFAEMPHGVLFQLIIYQKINNLFI